MAVEWFTHPLHSLLYPQATRICFCVHYERCFIDPTYLRIICKSLTMTTLSQVTCFAWYIAQRTKLALLWKCWRSLLVCILNSHTFAITKLGKKTHTQKRERHSIYISKCKTWQQTGRANDVTWCGCDVCLDGVFMSGPRCDEMETTSRLFGATGGYRWQHRPMARRVVFPSVWDDVVLDFISFTWCVLWVGRVGMWLSIGHQKISTGSMGIYIDLYNQYIVYVNSHRVDIFVRQHCL